MINTILVGIDCGDTSQTVFAQAINLAQATQASICLCSILAPTNDDSITFSPYSDRDWAAYTKRYQEKEKASLETLEALVIQAKEAGLDATFTLEIGNPGSAICTQAKSKNVDLIMVGSHGRTGLREMLLGSVSNYVVHHAPCSVMVVHGHG